MSKRKSYWAIIEKDELLEFINSLFEEDEIYKQMTCTRRQFGGHEMKFIVNKNDCDIELVICDEFIWVEKILFKTWNDGWEHRQSYLTIEKDVDMKSFRVVNHYPGEENIYNTEESVKMLINKWMNNVYGGMMRDKNINELLNN